jgi:hypothetical protein
LIFCNKKLLRNILIIAIDKGPDVFFYQLDRRRLPGITIIDHGFVLPGRQFKRNFFVLGFSFAPFSFNHV